MTVKVFWQDPYRRELQTRIAGIAGDRVTLAETIFYALSGGQESDAGTIGGRPVLAAQKSGSEIQYTLPAAHGLQPGDAVTVVIDWARRHRLMRLHFAAEIVLELAIARFPGMPKIGAHIAADKARIDFALDCNIAPAFPDFLAALDRLVAADIGIVSDFSDAAAERRYWEIPGFARVPCGGTHLRRTGEIGAVTLRRRNIGKGKERIEIQLVDAG